MVLEVYTSIYVRSQELTNRFSGTSNTEPRAVTAHLGQHTRPTSSVRQPLPATSPVPEGLMVMQDHQAVFEYDPGMIYIPLSS